MGNPPHRCAWSSKSTSHPSSLGGIRGIVSEIALAMQKAVRGNPFARAALEMACFDIAGQSIGVPAAPIARWDATADRSHGLVFGVWRRRSGDRGGTEGQRGLWLHAL
ncbi:hypothetical protein GOB14_30350 [Sinorhizobium meliloti]|nr:hypothetical protein [Sinorhizobium meliloti]